MITRSVANVHATEAPLFGVFGNAFSSTFRPTFCFDKVRIIPQNGRVECRNTTALRETYFVKDHPIVRRLRAMIDKLPVFYDSCI